MAQFKTKFKSLEEFVGRQNLNKIILSAGFGNGNIAYYFLCKKGIKLDRNEEIKMLKPFERLKKETNEHISFFLNYFPEYIYLCSSFIYPTGRVNSHLLDVLDFFIFEKNWKEIYFYCVKSKIVKKLRCDF